jgi:hypothetical protein
MKKQTKQLFTLLAIVAFVVLLAGWTQSLAMPTSTALPTGIFVSPLPSGQGQTAMAMIEEFAKQTATVQTAIVQTKQAQYAGTSVAQGTPTASVATVTPQPIPPTKTASEILLEEAKKLPIPQIDWYGLPIAGPILSNVKALGGDGLVGAFVTGIVLLFLGNLKKLKSGIYNIGLFIWKIILKQNKHYVFAQMYLDWLIGQYRHLGLLPAQVVAGRWGNRQQFVNLEQIYVRLSLSTQADDEAWNNNEENSKNRWGKQPITVVRSIRNIFLFLSSLKISLPNKKTISASGLAQFANRAFPETPYWPGALSLAVDRTQRLVIKGDPGSGKTTLLRYLAVPKVPDILLISPTVICVPRKDVTIPLKRDVEPNLATTTN